MLKGYLQKKCSTVAGPSGVGKSSLINMLQARTQMETGGISQKTERGRHTTRHSELIEVEKDTYILDTPGFTSLRMDDFEKEEIEEGFREILRYKTAGLPAVPIFMSRIVVSGKHFLMGKSASRVMTAM